MSRGGSYGGGRSSLGYLFGSDQPAESSQSEESSHPPVTPVASKLKPPWGDNNTVDERPKIFSPSTKPNASNNYRRSEGQNLDNFITDRPSTKVQSVPGGDSSLGYLFGDK